MTTKMLCQFSTKPILFMGNDGVSRATFQEYQDDYIRIALEMESKRYTFRHISRQLTHRKYLVGYLRKTCKDRGLTDPCLYLAIYFLDLYMDYHQINIRRLTLVAIASVMMAAKVEENYFKIPRLNDMMPLRNDEVKKYFSEIETLMLKFFKWDLLIPTAAHHVPYYMQVMLTEEERNRPGSPNIVNRMCKTVESYMHALLYDVHLMQGYSPSKVAAALIAACRIQHGYPEWNNELTKVSNQTPQDFEDILERILYGSFARKTINCINCFEDISYHYFDVGLPECEHER